MVAMAEDLCALCFEIIRVLAEQIEPKIDEDVNFDTCINGNPNEHGMLCVLRFLDVMNDSNCEIPLDSDELYWKLTDLANSILMADFGEVTVFQNFLYDRVTSIADLLKPETYHEPVPASEVFQQAVPSTSNWSHFHRSSPFVAPTIFEEPENFANRENPAYASIWELVHSIPQKNFRNNISARIDEIIGYFPLKSRHWCKNSFMNRVADIKEAVTIASCDQSSVSYENFLKFQVDEIYMLLQKDILYDGDRSVLTEIKVTWTRILEKIRKYFEESRMPAEKADSKFKFIANLWNQILEIFIGKGFKCSCSLTSCNPISCNLTNCNLIMCNPISVLIFSVLIVGFVTVV